MKYLRSRSFGLVALFIATIAYCQDNNKMSDLRNFPGIWKFIPPEIGYDSLVLVIHKNLMIDITYWNDTKNISIYGKPTIIGFSNVDDEINKLSKSSTESQYDEYDEQFQGFAIIIILLLIADSILLDKKDPLFKNIKLFSKK